MTAGRSHAQLAERRTWGRPAENLRRGLVLGTHLPELFQLPAGVQTGAGQLGRNLAQGPRQVAAILARLQTRMEEQRLSMQLQAQRDMPVDVQVAPLPGPAMAC